jgi:hypothetical protein
MPLPSLYAPVAAGGLAVCVAFAAWRSPLIGAALAVVLIAAFVHPVIMWPIAGGWCVLAWRAASRGKESEENADSPEKDAEGAAEEGSEEAVSERVPDPLLMLTANLIGNARGVHLKDIVQALNQAAPNRQRTTAEVRAALAQKGVFTRASVRAPKGAIPGAEEGVTQGIHRDDLEAAIGSFPVPTPKALSAEATTPATEPVTCDVATSATTVGLAVAPPRSNVARAAV